MIFFARDHEAAALHEGRQTRIIVPLREQPSSGIGPERLPPWVWRSKFGAYLGEIALPFSPGDRVSVKEAWAPVLDAPLRRDAIVYRADGGHCPAPWRSSAVMPAWAVRTHLTVKDVSVMRLQDVTENAAYEAGIDDERCCGVPTDACGTHIGGCCGQPIVVDLLEAFREAWTSRHGPDSWTDNPWCATATVERIET